ncbi:hypothetical protein L208DRAFT_1379036 [Tricholoma matsutake]|nr:hypothetical protein L208DRAFT_1379036 [Tricholoma matsutake 945]
MGSCQGMQNVTPHLWEVRPTFLMEPHLRSLLCQLKYADAVDAVTEIQRAIKDKAVWVEFAKQWLADVNWSWKVYQGSYQALTPADDLYMGMWINGVPKHHVFWLIKQRVPCFMIHELDTHFAVWYPEVPKCRGFFKKLEARFLGPRTDSYEHIAHRHDCIRSDYSGEEGIFKGLPSPISQEECERAFSRSQRWGGLPGVCEGLPVPICPQMPQSIPAPEPLPPSKYDAAPPETEVVEVGRVPWIVPPPVQEAELSGWMKWKEGLTERGDDCMQMASKRAEMCKKLYYDRESKQILEFSSNLPFPKGLVSDQKVFRLPAPNMPFEIQVNHR